MGRRIKNGLDYFNLDVHMDDKIELVEAKHGIEGFAVVLKLYQKIYSEGYFYQWTDKENLLFSKRNNIDYNVVFDIVETCIEEGIFDKFLFEKYNIITSLGIQKRYFDAIKKRKEIIVIKEYVIDTKIVKTIPTNVKVVINSINDGINSINDVNSTQSRVEKSRVENITTSTSKSIIKPEIIETYEKHFEEEISDVVVDDIFAFMDQGLEQELILETIKDGIRHKAKTWSYINTILKACVKNKVFTLENYINEKELRNHNCKSRDKPPNALDNRNNFDQRNHESKDFNVFFENFVK